MLNRIKKFTQCALLQLIVKKQNSHSMQNSKILPLLFCIFMPILEACSNIDCPLDNVVSMQCNLFSSETKAPIVLTDELTITPAGKDTLLLNKASNIKSFLLPLKVTAANNQVVSDTILLHFKNTAEQMATDTLFINHTLHPHFESLDCPASVFHTITAVRTTSHHLSEMPLTIDSVSLVRPIVNYDDVENIRIFLRSTTSK